MVKTETVSVNGINMKYSCFGDGEKTLVILPGLSVKSVCDSIMAVKRQFKDLLDYYTIFLFDRRKNIKPGYSIKDMSDDTASVMKSLGITHADIYGVSQGGMMAMRMAIDHPEIVNKLVLSSTVARFIPEYLPILQEWIELAEKGKKNELADSFAKNIYSKNMYDKFKNVFIKMGDRFSESELERFVILAESIKEFDVWDDLEKIKAKTIIFASTGDLFFGEKPAIEISKRLLCESYIYRDDYGHAVYDEADDFIGRVGDFLMHD